MKRLFSVAAATAVLTVLMALVACVSMEDIVSSLEGTWRITEKPRDDLWNTHAYITFTPGVQEIQLSNFNKTVFERGPIFRLQSHSFQYEVAEYTPDPDAVGARNYATYRVFGDTLTVTFYSDSSKSIVFGTIVAEKQP